MLNNRLIKPNRGGMKATPAKKERTEMTRKEKNEISENVSDAMRMLGKHINPNEVENYMSCICAVLNSSPKASQGFRNIVKELIMFHYVPNPHIQDNKNL